MFKAAQVYRRLDVKRLRPQPFRPDPDRLCSLITALNIDTDKRSSQPSLPLGLNSYNTRTAEYFENLTDMLKRNREDDEFGVEVEEPHADHKVTKHLLHSQMGWQS